MSNPGKVIVKSDKATVVRRINEVLRIILVGGDFEEIRQYAEAQGWGVCDRQLRRYQERAYQRFAQQTHRDQKQLMGRHLMQRRALYARAIKTNDIRTALNVLRDEAALQGLYELGKQGELPGPVQTTSVSRRERFKRMLAAKMRNDQPEVRLLEELSPTVSYALPDTQMAEMAIHTLSLMHIAEQLDRAAVALLAVLRLSQGDPQSAFWEEMAILHGWNFSVEREGWELFAKELGVRASWLIETNHRGVFLEYFGDQLAALSPEHGEVEKLLEKRGQSASELATAQSVARSWRGLLEAHLAR
ncbi:hypothetical protein [Bremerella cremea]|uniref:hypothetical protein n=1 Tax=Bremerella cremea TaxID=1031537 RepID=UPI0031E5565C